MMKSTFAQFSIQSDKIFGLTIVENPSLEGAHCSGNIIHFIISHTILKFSFSIDFPIHSQFKMSLRDVFLKFFLFFYISQIFSYACRSLTDTQSCATAIAECKKLCTTKTGELPVCQKRCIDDFATPKCQNVCNFQLQ